MDKFKVLRDFYQDEKRGIWVRSQKYKQVKLAKLIAPLYYLSTLDLPKTVFTPFTVTFNETEEKPDETNGNQPVRPS